MRKHVALFAATLALAACGGEKPTGQTSTATSGDEVADRLEDAADQSGLRAKQVLENAADEAREHPSLAPVEKPVVSCMPSSVSLVGAMVPIDIATSILAVLCSPRFLKVVSWRI